MTLSFLSLGARAVVLMLEMRVIAVAYLNTVIQSSLTIISAEEFCAQETVAQDCGAVAAVLL